MEGEYETTVRSVAAPHFEERGFPAEISWEHQEDTLVLTLTDVDHDCSGSIQITSDGIVDSDDGRVFAPENEIDGIDHDEQEVEIHCWIPKVNDGTNRFYVPLTDNLYNALIKVTETNRPS